MSSAPDLDALTRAASALATSEPLQRALARCGQLDGTGAVLFADPFAWAVGAHEFRIACTDGETHRVQLDAGHLYAVDHTEDETSDGARLMYALGADPPHCVSLVLASRAHTDGWFTADQHVSNFHIAALTYLHTAQRFAEHTDKVEDLRRLSPVLAKGIHPREWRRWQDAKIPPVQAATCRARNIDLPVVAAWRATGPLNGAAMNHAAAGVTPEQVDDLTSRGLREHEITQWSGSLDTLTAEQVVEMAQHTTHTPATAQKAISAVGYQCALAYGRLALTGTTDGWAVNDRYWWDITGADIPAAQQWNDLGLDPANAELLLEALSKAPGVLDGPAWAGQWCRAGVRTMDELLGLARLGVSPADVPNEACLHAPDGVPVPRDLAARLWQVSADPNAHLAAVITTAMNGVPLCAVPSCKRAGCSKPTGRGHGDAWDGTPEIATAFPLGHPSGDYGRAVAIEQRINALTQSTGLVV